MASESSTYSAMYVNHSNSLINPSNPVKKRAADKNNLKDRFNNVTSVYVPNDDTDRVLLTFNDENDEEYRENFHRNTLLQTLDDGLSYQVEYLSSFQSIIGRKSGEVQCSCVINDKMFLSFADESQIFKLAIDNFQLISESIWLPKVNDCPLYPIEIKANDKFIYISGKLIKLSSDETYYIIVKFNHDEQIIACTKRYSYPKFGSFDIDVDGNLIILSSQLEEEDNSLSQISKLTGGFESRQYYITLGDSSSRYLPTNVAAHGCDNKTWVTMQKINKETQEVEQRLMCFKCCFARTEGDKDELRNQLESSRWKLGGFNLGPLVTLNGQVLSIDNKLQNLCYIKWNFNQGHPIVRKISQPGSPNLINLCASKQNEAFLFTRTSVFRFKLIEQLIKDPEMLV